MGHTETFVAPWFASSFAAATGLSGSRCRPERYAILGPCSQPEGCMEAERRQITVLFTDMVGFTSFSEHSGEEAAFALQLGR